MKRKTTAAFIALIMSAQIFSGSFSVSASSQRNNLYGDCNGDEQVNVFDSIRLKQELMYSGAVDSENQIYGDCDNDLKITWKDYEGLSQHILEDKAFSQWALKGWYNDGVDTYYYNDASKLTGDQNIFGIKYRFQADGKFRTGLFNSNGSLYYADSSGFPIGGWKNIDNRKYYFGESDGKACTGNQKINSGHYYFDNNGVMKTDWQNLPTIVDTSTALYTYDNMTAQINKLCQQYPGLLKVNVLTQTYDQRNIYDVVFGNPNAKNQIVVQASCHGREYMTSMLVMNQLEFYLKNYYSLSYNNESFESIFSDMCVHIVPMLNPDGVSISQFGADIINKLDMRAALYDMYRFDLAHNITSLSQPQYFIKWKANSRGVDLNRNFHSFWTSDRPVKNPSSSGFPGECAASEIETQTLEKLVNSLPSLKMVLSYHSSGSYIYWAFGQTGEFRTRCQDMAQTIKQLTGYYLISGEDYDSGASNWVAGKGIIAETIEIGTGDSPLVLSEFADIFNRNKYVWAAIANKF
ncbi:MAG: M14 family zinc carboxypeptidase [Oscillospiraceae bacterium]|nr:M14 family zinc carboxypeptidase [Oscillospiraceae bacterium]